MAYTVIVMRPTAFMGVVEGMSRLQDLQYVATGISKRYFPIEAGDLARDEAYAADLHDNVFLDAECGVAGLTASDYIVLGHFEDELSYTPWLNGEHP